MTNASVPHAITGPPADRLYAVEPVGVARIAPSQPSSPIGAPSTNQRRITIRPRIPLDRTMSLTPTVSPSSAASVGSSTTS